ncbi:MAG: alpha/beta fold hydrolase [Solirubrobacterales bacterium]|nr:alpha/beta fold hydrolase [Solirubrobacterales bacterium]
MAETQKFTAGDGYRLAYQLDGPEDAPVVVLANSIATRMRMWDPQIATLSRVRRVLRYDYRGHGESDTPPGAYSVDRFGRDVLELLDHLGIVRFDFLGLSLGGMVGQWLGIHARERLNRLILANTAASLAPAAPWDVQIRTVHAARDNRDIAERFISNWFSHEADDPRLAPFREDLLAQDRDGLAGALALVRDMDFRPTAQLIRAPTLVLVGQYDTVTTAAHGQAIADRIPGAGFITLPGTHLTNVELASEFNAEVLRFLS